MDILIFLNLKAYITSFYEFIAIFDDDIIKSLNCGDKNNKFYHK